MTRISYAQNFEDIMLWRAVGDVENGFYIDIGAQDPDTDTVSRTFHEHGWTGWHVEPMSSYADALREKRPGDRIIEAAVSSRDGTFTFYALPSTGLSTLDADIAARHREAGFDVVETSVPVITLDGLLDSLGNRPVHWLKIDVEGAEQLVLEGWRHSNIRPWVLVIESTLPLQSEQSHEAWEPLVLGKGYRFVYFDGLNRFYVRLDRDDIAARFSAPPNVFDDFALSATASTPFRREFSLAIHAHNVHAEVERASFVQQAAILQEENAALKETRIAHEALTAKYNELTEMHRNNLLKKAELESRLQRVIAISEIQARQVSHAEARARETAIELEELRARFTESADSGYRWWRAAEALRAELDAVYVSKSWRWTGYLRSARRRLGPRRLLLRVRNGVRKGVYRVVLSAMHRTMSRPRIKAVVVSALRFIPPLHDRLLKIRVNAHYQALALHAERQVKRVNRGTDENQGIFLTPRAAMTYQALKRAIDEQKAA